MIYDAHNHLQDGRLNPFRAEIMASLGQMPLGRAVVNGTHEADWSGVTALAEEHAWVLPSYGLHPWFVKERSHHWAERLEENLKCRPEAAVGEIGLDRWIENPDLPAQVQCFRTQLSLAHKLDRPATIHCLRAWGHLEKELRSQPLPGRGFLLHSYGGPAEMIPAFVKMGAYFSVSPYFGHSRKSDALALFKMVPPDRLLAETDAPDMRPPDDLNPHPLQLAAQPLNHPANIEFSYNLLAELFSLPPGELISQLETNFQRLFQQG